MLHLYIFFFFFNDTATTEIYTLSLHDALPISGAGVGPVARHVYCLRIGTTIPTVSVETYFPWWGYVVATLTVGIVDRKSTRLNSSHLGISYAVFCLKKKKHITSQSLLMMIIAV